MVLREVMVLVLLRRGDDVAEYADLRGEEVDGKGLSPGASPSPSSLSCVGSVGKETSTSLSSPTCRRWYKSGDGEKVG